MPNFTQSSPILMDLPMPIQTPRLLIRPIMPGDGALIFEGICESFEQFKKWLPWAQQIPTTNLCEETAREFYADFILRKAMHFVVMQDDQCVGMCSYDLIDWDVPSANIGYWCRISAQGEGIMTEAVHALVRYGFDTIKFLRLTIICHIDNIASRRVAEKSGFVLEAENFGLIASVMDDELVMGRRYARTNDQ